MSSIPPETVDILKKEVVRAADQGDGRLTWDIRPSAPRDRS